MSFPERLASLRNRSKLSQRRLGQLAGLSARHVALLESAEDLGPKVAASTLGSLAEVLGCTVDHLMFGTEPDPTDEQIAAAVAAAVDRERDAAPKEAS